MEPLTPTVLANLYRRLSTDDKIAFLGRIGKTATAETLIHFCGALSATEQDRFSQMHTEQGVYFVLPALVREARQFAKNSPEGSDEEAEAWIRQQYERATLEHSEAVQRLTEAETKEPYARGPKARANIMKERDEKIENEAISNGITDPKDILHFLNTNYPHLAKSGGKPIIDAQGMMKGYKKRRKCR